MGKTEYLSNFLVQDHFHLIRPWKRNFTAAGIDCWPSSHENLFKNVEEWISYKCRKIIFKIVADALGIFNAFFSFHMEIRDSEFFLYGYERTDRQSIHLHI
jgi:hypothetical protein